MAGFVPKQALDYLKQKDFRPAFSYRDVWAEEHATAFTVAKATQLDVLSDIKGAVEKALAEGQSFESFKKNLAPTLQEKGWWGRKTMVDPQTGEVVDAQLGSDRRLKTIYQVNTRQAYLKGAWDRGMASTAHPYIMYCLGPSLHHRQDHQAWAGLVLPKDDPFWDTHAPMNGWGCKCFLRFLTQSTVDRYQSEGTPVGPGIDGPRGQTIPIKTEAPPVKYQTYVDKRTGRVTQVPEGITPGFEWNPGSFSRSAKLTSDFYQKTQQLANRDKVMTRFFQAPQLREEYGRFVTKALAGSTGQGNISVIGYLQDDLLKALEPYGKKPASGLVAIEEKLLRSKNADHGEAGLSKQEWLQLPDLFRDWDLLLWNIKQDKPVFVKELGEKSALIMAFDLGTGIRRGKTSFDIDALRSVYKKARSLKDLLADSDYTLIKKKDR